MKRHGTHLSVLVVALMLAIEPARPETHLSSEAVAEIEADWMAQADAALRAGRMLPGVDPGAAVDECNWIGTGLHAGGKREPAWWQIDLGDTHPLAQISVLKREFQADRAARMRILLSEDSKYWREVFRHDGSAVEPKFPLNVDLKGAPARYIRLVVPPGDGVQLDDVKVFSSQNTGRDLARGQPASQSATIGLARPTGMPDLVDGVLERGALLVAELHQLGAEAATRVAETQLAEVARERDALAKSSPDGQDAAAAWRSLYLKARWTVREAAFENPLLDFDELLLVRRHWPGGHQAAHHVGEYQKRGADLSILKGLSPEGEIRSVIDGQLPPGAIGRPDLSFDARRIAFPYAPPRQPPTEYPVSHLRGGDCLMYDLYEIGVDGTRLRRLTNCPDSEDTEPCYLPNGRIAFTTSREKRFVQCGDWALALGIYSIAADGSDPRKVTDTKEGEYYPSVLDDGRLIYMRWEYVMKAFNTVQPLWTVYPDGTRAQLAYGDYWTFSPGPQSFIEPRQIPGTGKVVANATSHHGSGGGSICHDGTIALLPALPSTWASGSVRGLRARGGIIGDIDWKDCKVTDYRLTATGTPLDVKVLVNGERKTVKTSG